MNLLQDNHFIRIHQNNIWRIKQQKRKIELLIDGCSVNNNFHEYSNLTLFVITGSMFLSCKARLDRPKKQTRDFLNLIRGCVKISASPFLRIILMPPPQCSVTLSRFHKEETFSLRSHLIDISWKELFFVTSLALSNQNISEANTSRRESNTRSSFRTFFLRSFYYHLFYDPSCSITSHLHPQHEAFSSLKHYFAPSHHADAAVRST